jgi:outer membrane protein TolC
MRFCAIFVTFISTAGLWAQQASVFPAPAYFRDHFFAPTPRVELQPPVRLDDFVVDDKLELSLRGYLELVMANNTDITIQKVSLETQKNALLRAFSSFDPRLTASFQTTRTVSPSSDVLQGAATLNALSQPANFTYTQTLQNGATYNVGFSGSKTSNNSAFQTFNPALSAALSFSVTQPLLQNRGTYITRIPILIARSRLRSAEYNLRDQIMRLLASAESAYWDVVEARENVKLQEAFLEMRIKSLQKTQREIELGATSRLDIFKPEADKAAAEIAVSQARFRLAQVEDALRRQIGADLDPRFRKMPLNLTETVLPPTDVTRFDPEIMVEQALALRPDLKATLEGIEVADMGIKQAKNALLPNLSLTLGYTSTGRGGNYFQRSNVFTDIGSSTIISMTPGGFGDAISQLFGFNYPTYQARIQLTLPIRDRAAQANFADALVQKRLQVLQARSIEQNIRLQVLNAISQVESSKAAVQLASVSVDLAQKNLDAAQQKYDLGTTILYFVLDAQTQLAAAQASLLRESIGYRRNLLNLYRMTGQLLEERGVLIE